MRFEFYDNIKENSKAYSGIDVLVVDVPQASTIFAIPQRVTIIQPFKNTYDGNTETYSEYPLIAITNGFAFDIPEIVSLSQINAVIRTEDGIQLNQLSNTVFKYIPLELLVISLEDSGMNKDTIHYIMSLISSTGITQNQTKSVEYQRESLDMMQNFLDANSKIIKENIQLQNECKTMMKSFVDTFIKQHNASVHIQEDTYKLLKKYTNLH